VAVEGISFVGLTPSVLSFTLRSLKADVWDTLSVQSYRLFGQGLGVASRPTRYALICEEEQTTEADNVLSERQVRAQLVDNKGGFEYNRMLAGIDRGEEQPIFILTRVGPGGARFCSVRAYRRQECTCGGQYNAKERARIPAKDLFGPPKPLQ
jgi:hypothetical protein